MQTRITLIAAVFLFFFSILVVRLFFWQIIKGGELSSQARSQYEKGELVFATRGNIFAKDGTWLAARGPAWLVFAELPKLEKKPSQVAELLAPYFIKKEEGEEEKEYKIRLLDEIERIEELLSKKDAFWVPIKHKITPDDKRSIEELDIAGLGMEPEETRIYPEASSAAHILGFVGKNEEGEDTGYFGLEGHYDLSLSGKHGFLQRESDAKGVPILSADSLEIGAVGGVDLITNIDKTVQLIIEKRLTEGIEKYGAQAGSVVVANPKNGAVYGMVSFPSYDPSEYFDFSDELFKNPVVSSSFEPGSIFKVLVMSAALDAGVVKPDTVCEICTGPLKVDKYYIRTWDDKYHPDSTMVDIIVNSDNVGMAYVGQKLGADELYDYLSAFGLGTLTGVDLQGEVSPQIRPKGTWNIVDLSTTSFGQGIAVTPIQMIRAVSAIANKGRLPTPHVVDRLRGEGWEENITPKDGPQVISEDTAEKLTAMMVEAAKHGEAKWTYLRGFKVAGKTGTAQIPFAGHYDEEKTIASFVGFAPANEPKFIMLVTLREPSSSPWSSETAAPLWYSIAKDLFLHFGIQPEN